MYKKEHDVLQIAVTLVIDTPSHLVDPTAQCRKEQFYIVKENVCPVGTLYK